ncbi:WAS/WASL-interacting protein family member 3-like [Grammomys surdaster]|uniref:WAS/WASL-interacting protein family member 3-like n=1 Tax=Grammomys surdaster TaxID=491861 RepID=UPI00109F4AD1|nr:WAS/WASL-interacting protein family member 3-like [Grammomys surdaster]
MGFVLRAPQERAPSLGLPCARAPQASSARPAPRGCPRKDPAPPVSTHLRPRPGPRTFKSTHLPCLPSRPPRATTRCSLAPLRRPGYLKGSVSGTTAKWLSLPGPLRRPPIGPCPPPPPPPLAGVRSLATRLALGAAAPRRSRRSRLYADQVCVRRGCWGLENRAELVEPSKS